MRVAINEPFHVNCEHTKRSICYCVEGTPPELRDPTAAKQYAENAEILNQFWQRPAEALFNSTDAVDVIVPRLLRRERVQAAPPKPPKDELTLKLEESKRKAFHSAKMAASLAARGGLLYSPPIGVDIKEFMQGLKMHDQTKLEEAVAQIFRNRSAMGIAATKEAASPYSFVRHGVNGSGAAAATATPALVPMEGLTLAQQQQQLMITNPQRMVFPKEHQRGPRKRGPPKAWRLAPEHNGPNLIGQLIQILVESPREWRPAIVSAVHTADESATVVFESNAMQVVPMKILIKNEEVAWLTKEQVEEQNIRRHTTAYNINTTTSAAAVAAVAAARSGGSAGGGSAAKKRGAATAEKMVSTPATKYQMVSPFSPLSGLAAAPGFAVAGVNGSMSANGYQTAGIHPPAVTLKKTAAVEEEEDNEKLVLERLKGVTKRQRAAAAKKAAGARAHSGVISDSFAAPAPAAADMGAHSLSRQERQASITLPTGFIPLDDNNLPTTSRQNSIHMGNSSLGYGYQQQTQQPQLLQHQHQQQQQQQQRVVPLPAAPTAALIMPMLFQLGDDIMRGKGLQLTINHISLPAIVIKIDIEKQSVLLAVKGRTVVLNAPDEGVRFKLAFI